MPSHTDLNIHIAIKSRFVLGLGFLSLVVVLLLHWVPALAAMVPILGLSAGAYCLWAHWKKEQIQQVQEQAAIDAMFYQRLLQQQGRISVLEFAMHTQMEVPWIQAYLNAQAQSLAACYETTPHGDIIYVFNPMAVQQVNHHHRAAQAEVAWAYVEPASMEQAHRRAQAQTAWANARQIRALRQLSQQKRQHSAGYIAITATDCQGKNVQDVEMAGFEDGESGHADSEGRSENKQSTRQRIANHRDIQLPHAGNGVGAAPQTVVPQTVVRGRAIAPEHIVTIDVPAVRG